MNAQNFTAVMNLDSSIWSLPILNDYLRCFICLAYKNLDHEQPSAHVMPLLFFDRFRGSPILDGRYHQLLGYIVLLVLYYWDVAICRQEYCSLRFRRFDLMGRCLEMK
jgi:hypothetical protein